MHVLYIPILYLSENVIDCDSVNGFCLSSKKDETGRDFYTIGNKNVENIIRFEKRFYDFEIDENSPIGTLVGDRIRLENYEWKYRLEISESSFAITPRTGQIYSRELIDYENNPLYQFQVNAYLPNKELNSLFN